MRKKSDIDLLADNIALKSEYECAGWTGAILVFTRIENGESWIEATLSPNGTGQSRSFHVYRMHLDQEPEMDKACFDILISNNNVYLYA